TLNGRTAKQQNPHPTASLAWAAWMIARLGGWSGYRSQRPHGIVTFERGLQVFQGMFAVWLLAHT
ncbi:MAG: IS4 family transposase, partial [Cyanobacteria bacterium P01_C01_bin.147]